jgi:hypothetical protein
VATATLDDMADFLSVSTGVASGSMDIVLELRDFSGDCGMSDSVGPKVVTGVFKLMVVVATLLGDGDNGVGAAAAAAAGIDNGDEGFCGVEGASSG